MRGHGEGTIYQRNGKWTAALRLPDGKRKYRYTKTRAEAAKWLAAAIRDRDKGLLVGMDDRQTVAQYLTTWLETVKHRVKPKTYSRYGIAIRQHLIPALGKVKLTRLTAQQIQTCYTGILDAGRAPATAAHVHAVLHAALDNAEKLAVIPRNPADLVKPPRAVQHEMHALDPEQARRLLTAVSGDRLEALYVLAVMCGLRQGEILGLRWSDADLDAGTLQIRFTLSWGKAGTWQLTTPKTARSRRRIVLPPLATAALKAHRLRQNAERLRIGGAWQENDLVFCHEDGTPIRGVHLTERHFVPLLKRAGLPRIRFHDLRHTAATLLLIQGVPPKVVSELLGHSSVAITLDRYSHVVPSLQESAAAAMERVFAIREA